MIAALKGDDTTKNDSRKALVCVFLRGGADTVNMLVPYGDDDYYRLRKSIAIAKKGSGGVVALDDFYGFHPKLSPLLPAYRDGRLAIVQAVGTDNPTGSHFDSQDQVEHGQSYSESLSGGWLGRYLQTIGSHAASAFSAVAIGSNVPLTLAGAPIANAIQSVDEVRIEIPSNASKALTAAIGAMYRGGGDAPKQLASRDVQNQASLSNSAAERLAASLDRAGSRTLELLARIDAVKSHPYSSENGAEYPQDGFGSGLREIARLIKSGLGLQAATIDLAGWDTHFFQGGADGQQAHLIDSFSRGLAAFDQDMYRYRDQVVLVTVTEFGRRSYENGSLGTDHGRGFAMFVLNFDGQDAIRGGHVTGGWPGLIGEQGPGPGGLKVCFDFRSVLAEVVSTASGGPRSSEIVFPGIKGVPTGS